MYRLQILHASDLEGGIDAIDNAPGFAAVVDALEADAAAQGIDSVLVSSGDNIIPGPFFNAGGDSSLAGTYEGFYNAFFGLIDSSALPAAADTSGDGFFDNSEIEAAIDAGTVAFGDVYVVDVNGDGAADYFEEIDTAPGRLDMAIMNALGFDASAIGNHEFDNGSGALEEIVNYDSEEGNSLSDGRYGTVNYLQEVDTPGIQFPYLSANLDFSADGDLGALFTSDILPTTAFRSDLLSARANPDDPSETASDGRDSKVAPAAVIERDGELIGVVGVTTQLVATISSPGDIEEVSSDGTVDMPDLAAVLQPVVNAVIAGADGVAGTGDDVNKIILATHNQQFPLDVELAPLMTGVDVILSGGSDTISADATDMLRPGDTAGRPYPFVATGGDGNPVLIVSTAGEYAYVGRLVVTFDENGVVDPTTVDPAESGAFATDEAGVVAVTGAASFEAAVAASEKARDVDALASTVTAVVTALDADIAGESEVYLNGERGSVRTEETNLGNLTADANLAAARAIDPEVLVSIKNGGGIRAPIGEIVDNGDGTVSLLPPQANPLSGKEDGEVSELDIDNSLRFDNSLSIVELTPEELKIILEHGVAGTGPGNTPGQFPQVGGLHFSFDPEGTAQVVEEDGTVTTPGTRVRNVTLLGEDGLPDRALVRDGAVVAGAPDTIKVVTLGFLAGGGDGYPFAAFSAETDLGIGEQEALSTFLTGNFPPDAPGAFSGIDTGAGLDARIQNLSERSDTVDAPLASETVLFELTDIFVGEGGEGASEVVAHADGRLYVTNGAQDRIDVFEIGGPDAPVLTMDLSGLEGYDGVQSVAVANGVVAAAVARPAVEVEVFGETTFLSQLGFVALFDAETGDLLSTVDVGNLPDAVAFTPDGNALLVAGEGEKNEDSDNDDDPAGTVGLVDVTDPSAPLAFRIGFEALDGVEDAARAAGIRIQEGVPFSLDVEPEYITVAPSGGTAYVSLQENNAIAAIDLEAGAVADILPLGTVDFSAESALDANDDEIIDIRSFDDLVGLRMPDAIVAFETGGTTYIATANEGDSRGFDEARVEDLEEAGLIDESVDTTGLGRLEVSTIDGDTDGDGDIDVLHAFSSRSFSIFDTEGNLVFDSGADFERIIAERAPERFNDDDGELGQNRSDAKGPEPEAIAVGEVDGRVIVVIGLERDSGLMLYDATDPANASFVNYIPGAFVGMTGDDGIARHAPEVIDFIPAEESTTGRAQVAVSYEVSGTTAVFDLFAEGEEPNRTIVGTDADETLVGGNGDDTILGRGGDDRLVGREGDDRVAGGQGADVVLGNDGDDELSGGTGFDRLRGGDGDDFLRGQQGRDRLGGSDGNDRLFGGGNDDGIDGGAGADTALGGDGADSILGGTGDDLLRGQKGADELAGGDGDDSIGGGARGDMIDGGAGADIVLGGNGADSILGGTGDDLLRGQDGADEIVAGDGDDSIGGGKRADLLLGQEGDDLIGGGDGRDTIDGGEGNDTIAGQNGDDIISGGLGEDTFFFTGAFGDDFLIDFDVADDTIEIDAGEGDVLITEADTPDGLLVTVLGGASGTMTFAGVTSADAPEIVFL